jgi:hypothetical protein
LVATKIEGSSSRVIGAHTARELLAKLEAVEREEQSN